MKFVKKIAKNCLIFKIQAESLNINYKKIIEKFNLESIYVELFGLKINDLAELNKFNCEHFIKDSDNVCFKVINNQYEAFFNNLEFLDYEEINIWDSSMNWIDFCKDKQRENAIFYLNYNSYENKFCEIICDKVYDKIDFSNI